jgi:ATP:ADP antiporter, AAA family
MSWIARRFRRTTEEVRLLAIMALFFLVVCAVGILRPIKNSLALDGLGATDFYKVYLVSAVVVLFVPIFTRAADRTSWRALIPLVAAFFATNLVVFRFVYVEGSALFGIVFYGWYDLFAAALVTQFFMATQLYFDARSAKRAYPIVIAGGSIGATLGGAITGFLAESVGTPNLLLVAAALIMVFAAAMPLAWGTDGSYPAKLNQERPRLEAGELKTVFSNRQVRLIAATVLITIIVKQFVDFQFNALTKEVFETRDAVSAFQGKFNAATQWLPLVVLAALRPALRRWGVGLAVLLLPIAMFGATLSLAVAFGIVAVVAAKATETSLRYSSERAAREILYIPVPDEIKLKAKAWIDVAVEKGVGKVLSALLLGALLSVVGMRAIAFVTAGLSALWLASAIAVRREYVRTLARSIEGRFASLRGLFVTLSDASSAPVLRAGLTSDSPTRSAFAMKLLAQADADDIRDFAPELNALARDAGGGIRAAALTQLARIPESADEALIHDLLSDPDAAVSAAAVRVRLARASDDASLLRELLGSPRPAVRAAALRHVVGSTGEVRALGREYLEARWEASNRADAETRAELAIAVGVLEAGPRTARYLDVLLNDPDPRVRSLTLGSAALLRRADHVPRMIEALGDSDVAGAARDALIAMGETAVPGLAAALLDQSTPARARRAIPAVLSRIPAQETVEALLRLVPAPETDQLLDYRSVKALSKLRERHPGLRFDSAAVWLIVEHECRAADEYRAALARLNGGGASLRSADGLLRAALQDGLAERRESVFRCIGLLHHPHDVYRAYVASTFGSDSQRANALEWLEQNLGYARYLVVAKLVELKPKVRPRTAVQVAEAHAPNVAGATRSTVRAGTLAGAIGPALAATTAVTGTTVTNPAIFALTNDSDPWIARLASHHATASPRSDETMELIEKVLLLQQVEPLRDARGSHLALLASIAEELEVSDGTELIATGEPTTAMYVVTRGEVELQGVGERLRIGEEQPFGTWALIDESPSPIAAVAVGPARVLRIHRSDFHDLLADHSELAIGLLQGLANRIRNLVA